MPFYELSRMLGDKESVYPSDPSFRLEKIKSVEKDGFSDYQISSGMHVGTHIDAPGHIIEGGKLVSDYPITKFIGRAICIDVRNIEIIDIEHLQAFDIAADDIVLLNTGHEMKYGENEYYSEHPVISLKLADWLIHKKIKLLGMDLPSPDFSPYQVHHLLLDNDILLIENLTNLSSIVHHEHIDFWAFPTAVCTTAAWIRVVVSF